MIQKVSKQEQMDWLDAKSDGPRDSMNKSALSSFTSVIKKMAHDTLSKGGTISDVAKKFSLSEDVVRSIIEDKQEPEVKIACACDNETPSDDKGKDDALEAYAAMYGKKQASDVEGTVGRGSSVFSARGQGGTVSDNGAPHKYMRHDTANTIWDSEVIERATKAQGNDERIREENTRIAAEREENKKISRYETINGDSLVEALKQVDQRKAAGVSSISGHEAHNFTKKLPQNGMSIFDTEFNRVPEKTAGEQSVETKKAEANKPKDRSWVEGKSVSSKSIFNNMIDSLTKGK